MTESSSVDITGLMRLESITIGDRSCVSLTEVIVGSTSFMSLFYVTIGSNSLIHIPSLPLSLTSPIRSLIVGSNSMTALKRLELNESTHLKAVSVGSGSLCGVESVILGGTNLEALQDFGFYPHEMGYSFYLNSTSILRNVMHIEMKEDANATIYRFIIRGLSKLKTIRIESSCTYGAMEEDAFVIEDCPNLTSVIIGDCSFIYYRVLILKDCPRLSVFEVGMKSFRYVERIEISRIGLVSITIGNQQLPRLESFSVNGLNDLSQVTIGEGNGIVNTGSGKFIIISCAQLTTVIIGDGSFQNFGIVTIKNNPMLTGIEFGSWCFSRANDVRLIGIRSCIVTCRLTESSIHHSC